MALRRVAIEGILIIAPIENSRTPAGLRDLPDRFARVVQNQNYCSLNLIVTVMCIGTGLPCSCAGAYFQRLNASFAAPCKIAGPETIAMLVTCPVASIRASIVTAPPTR